MPDVTAVLRGGILLTLNATLDVLEDAAIGIAADRIAWVAPGSAQPEVPAVPSVVRLNAYASPPVQGTAAKPSLALLQGPLALEYARGSLRSRRGTPAIVMPRRLTAVRYRTMLSPG